MVSETKVENYLLITS